MSATEHFWPQIEKYITTRHTQAPGYFLNLGFVFWAEDFSFSEFPRWRGSKHRYNVAAEFRIDSAEPMVGRWED